MNTYPVLFCLGIDQNIGVFVYAMYIFPYARFRLSISTMYVVQQQQQQQQRNEARVFVCDDVYKIHTTKTNDNNPIDYDDLLLCWYPVIHCLPRAIYSMLSCSLDGDFRKI